MDDLLALFEENPTCASAEQEKEEEQLARDADSVTNTNIIGSNSSSPQNRSCNNDGTAASLDDRLGIRVTQYQQTNSLELLDIITSQPFVAPASLCAASLKKLNQYLIQPATMLDAACVAGATTLCTVGTLFEFSGTRLTQSGTAFSKLQIGTLVTGPCVTVLLFGDAYRQFANKKAGPGMVLLLRNPRLMPSSHNGPAKDKTTITLSLNDPQQLVCVGTDRDYGGCQATVGGKNPQTGQWVPNLKRCSGYIDKRQGSYCPKHRQCAQQKNKGNNNKLQTLREEHNSQSASSSNRTTPLQPGERRMVLPNGTSQSLFASQQQTQIQPHRLQPQAQPLSRSDQMMASFNQKYGTRSSFVSESNGIGNNNASICSNTSGPATITPRQDKWSKQPPQQEKPIQPFDRGLIRPAMRPKPSQHINNTASQPTPSAMPTRQNPYANNSHKTGGHTVSQTTTRAKPAATASAVNLDHILRPPSSSTKNKRHSQRRPSLGNKQACSNPTKRRETNQGGGGWKRTRQSRNSGHVNTDTGDFDGSVWIPKAQTRRVPLGPRQGAQPCQASHSQSSSLKQVNPRESEIREKQQQLATNLCLQKNQPNHQRNPTKKNDIHCRSERDALLFKHVTQADLDRAATATSLFADQVKDEDYAIQRRAVVELEEREERQQNKGKRVSRSNVQGTVKAATKIQKEWRCLDCGKVYSHPPQSCRRQNHRITCQRNVTETRSMEENRQTMNDSEGALRLGSGLHWSQNRFGE